jgi:hypothetical protein
MLQAAQRIERSTGGGEGVPAFRRQRTPGSVAGNGGGLVRPRSPPGSGARREEAESRRDGGRRFASGEANGSRWRVTLPAPRCRRELARSSRNFWAASLSTLGPLIFAICLELGRSAVVCT